MREENELLLDIRQALIAAKRAKAAYDTAVKRQDVVKEEVQRASAELSKANRTLDAAIQELRGAL